MLSKLHRFHGHRGVRRVYRLGKPVRSGMFSLHLLQNDKVKNSKAAVVVSRKVHKSAVRRNLIRRRIYELVRVRMPEFKMPSELVITVYQPEIADLPPAELERAVDELFARARL